MKKFLKIILEIFLGIVGLSLVLLFLSFSAKSEIVPDIYVYSDSGKIALAVRGGYKWNSFSESVIADSIAPSDYVYTNSNVLLVTPNEKMTFKNSENAWDCHKFYQLEMCYYDEENNITEVPPIENSKTFADLKYLEVNAPADEGTYIYNFKFSYYTKGEVSYGLKVIVSDKPNYDIDELINYRNTKVTDVNLINNMLNILPYSKDKKGIIIKETDSGDELSINYTEFTFDRDEIINNTITIFTLIPKLNQITYISDAERMYFTRQEIEFYVGRSLNDYAENLELWRKEMLYKEKVVDELSSKDNIYKAIIDDILSEYNPDQYVEVAVNTKSFIDNEILSITKIDRQEILEYASTYAPVVYDVDFEGFRKLASAGVYISLNSIKDKAILIEELPSGDTINNYGSGDYTNMDNKYICTLMSFRGRETRNYNYEIEYSGDKWNITKLENVE